MHKVIIFFPAFVFLPQHFFSFRVSSITLSFFAQKYTLVRVSRGKTKAASFFALIALSQFEPWGQGSSPCNFRHAALFYPFHNFHPSIVSLRWKLKPSVANRNDCSKNKITLIDVNFQFFALADLLHDDGHRHHHHHNHNHEEHHQSQSLRDRSMPNAFSRKPFRSDFTCKHRHPGYYADMELNCEVSHSYVQYIAICSKIIGQRKTKTTRKQGSRRSLSLTCKFSLLKNIISFFFSWRDLDLNFELTNWQDRLADYIALGRMSTVSLSRVCTYIRTDWIHK